MPVAEIVCTEDLKAAATGADLLYTDVWVSMGKEAEAAERIKVLGSYQINQALVKLAKPGALVMHCLPAYRGKEIDEATFEEHAQTIFDEAENRLQCTEGGAELDRFLTCDSNQQSAVPVFYPDLRRVSPEILHRHIQIPRPLGRHGNWNIGDGMNQLELFRVQGRG